MITQETLQSEPLSQQASQNSDLSARREGIAEGFRNHTKGEGLFNKISYIGFGYFLTTGVSVGMTWFLRDTKIANGFQEAGTKLLTRVKLPPSLLNIFALFTGGTLASVLPVKWLENNKPKLVRQFDHLYYTDDQIAHDPTIRDAYKTLDAEPRQTWRSVITSRFVAFAATMSIFTLMGPNESLLAKKTGESIDKRSIQFSRWFDKVLSRNAPGAVAEIDAVIAANESAIASGKLKGLELLRSPEHAAVDRQRTRIWNYISMDAFYTIFTSASLFVFTRILGPVFGTHQKPEQKNAVVEAIAPTPLSTESKAVSAENQPRTAVSQTTHLTRVAPVPEPQLSA